MLLVVCEEEIDYLIFFLGILGPTVVQKFERQLRLSCD